MARNAVFGEWCYRFVSQLSTLVPDLSPLLSGSAVLQFIREPDLQITPIAPEADPWLYPGQGELNIWTLLPLDFNHAAINDDFGASYKTRIITCKKQNRLRKLHRLAHSLHWNDRV